MFTQEQVNAVAVELGGGEYWFWEYPNSGYDRERYREKARLLLDAAEKAAKPLDEAALGEVVAESKKSWLQACGDPGHTEEIDVWIARDVAGWLKGQTNG